VHFSSGSGAGNGSGGNNGGAGGSGSSKNAQASSRQLARSTRARIMRTNGNSVRGQASRSTGVIIGGTTSGRSLVHTVPATFVPEEVSHRNAIMPIIFHDNLTYFYPLADFASTSCTARKEPKPDYPRIAKNKPRR
jgi:hypothetical protein